MSITESPTLYLDRIETMLTTTRETAHHGPAVQSMIERILDLIGRLHHELEELQAYAPIVTENRLLYELRAAQAYWLIQPADQVLTDIAGLVAISPTLTALTKAGCEFTSARRFGSDQTDLACRIAEAFAPCAHYLGALSNPKYADVTISGRYLTRITFWLRDMAKRGLADGFAISGSFRGQPKRDLTRRGNPKGATGGKITKGRFDPALAQQLAGHWLENYHDWITTDHLSRIGRPHEVYTNLSYTLPRDLGGGSSEIDVLARTEAGLTLTECKAGRMTDADGALSKTCRHALRSIERFEHVAQEMGVAVPRTYQLLCIPRGKETTESLQQAVSEASAVPVHVLAPSDVRRTIQIEG